MTLDLVHIWQGWVMVRILDKLFMNTVYLTAVAEESTDLVWFFDDGWLSLEELEIRRQFLKNFGMLYSSTGN